jgi:signal transduction histidine kinase/CheY-like chemotaxis protein
VTARPGPLQGAAFAGCLALAAAAGASLAAGHPPWAACCALALTALVLAAGRRVGNAFAQSGACQARLEAEVAARTEELARRGEELAATVARLEAARTHLGVTDRLAAVGRLAAGLAHEINNPLAVALTNLGWLREAPEAPAADRAAALAEAEAAAQRIAGIVRDVQDFAQERREATGAADLVHALRHVERLVAHQIVPRARLRLELPPHALPVAGSASRLGQLFAHLLLHAGARVEEGRADRSEVRLVAAADGPGAVVEVRATGRPLAPEELAHVFDPFHASWSEGAQLGLGLAVCHGIVVALGGEITAEATPEGSVYRVRVPGPARDAPRHQATAPRRPRVLVVDDEPLVCASVYRVLSRHFDVAPHTSARHAFQLVRAGERFDAVLLDLMMPEMSGPAFHAELARLAPELGERTIFLTGGAFTPQARAFLDSVPNPRVQKPFDPAELTRLVASRCAATPAAAP